MSEDQVIIDEITEELKQDQLIQFIRKHQKGISVLILGILAIVVIYTSWNNRNKKELTETTSSLLNMLNSPLDKQEAVLTSMIHNAPSKILPILEVLHTGIQLKRTNPAALQEKHKEIYKRVEEFSKKNGIDIALRDLIVLIYISHSFFNDTEAISLIKPLTEAGRPFRLIALEFLGIFHMYMGQSSEAINKFTEIEKDLNSTQSMKKRANILIQRALK